MLEIPVPQCIPRHVAKRLVERGHSPPSGGPDFTISEYLRRWVLEASEERCAYLHLMAGPDKPLLHSHPYGFDTEIIQGSYVQVYFEDGDETARRLQLRGGDVGRMPEGGNEGTGPWHVIAEVEELTWTLVETGPRVRDWGFLVPLDVGDDPLGIRKPPTPTTHGYLPHRGAQVQREAKASANYHGLGSKRLPSGPGVLYPQLEAPSQMVVDALGPADAISIDQMASWRRRGHAWREIGLAAGMSHECARRHLKGMSPREPSAAECARAAEAIREMPERPLARHASEFDVSPALFATMLRRSGAKRPSTVRRRQGRIQELSVRIKEALVALGGEASAAEIRRHIGEEDAPVMTFTRAAHLAGATASSVGPGARWRLGKATERGEAIAA